MDGTGGLASSIKNGARRASKIAREAKELVPLLEYARSLDEARVKSHSQFSSSEMQAAMDKFQASKI